MHMQRVPGLKCNYLSDYCFKLCACGSLMNWSVEQPTDRSIDPNALLAVFEPIAFSHITCSKRSACPVITPAGGLKKKKDLSFLTLFS